MVSLPGVPTMASVPLASRVAVTPDAGSCRLSRLSRAGGRLEVEGLDANRDDRPRHRRAKGARMLGSEEGSGECLDDAGEGDRDRLSRKTSSVNRGLFVP